MVTVGDVLNFFNKMDNDMKTTTDMSLQEQDELCRRAGFPTITEQKSHWNTKDLEAVDKAQLVQAVEAMAVFLDQMNKAIGTFREALNRLTK